MSDDSDICSNVITLIVQIVVYIILVTSAFICENINCKRVKICNLQMFTPYDCNRGIYASGRPGQNLEGGWWMMYLVHQIFIYNIMIYCNLHFIILRHHKRWVPAARSKPDFTLGNCAVSAAVTELRQASLVSSMCVNVCLCCMLYVLHVGAWKSSLLAKGYPTLNKIPNPTQSNLINLMSLMAIKVGH